MIIYDYIGDRTVINNYVTVRDYFFVKLLLNTKKIKNFLVVTTNKEQLFILFRRCI